MNIERILSIPDAALEEVGKQATKEQKAAARERIKRNREQVKRVNALRDGQMLLPDTGLLALDDFAQALVQTEFTLSLKDDEQVTAVVVIGADGSERTLAMGDYEFDEVTQKLSIEPTAIGAADSNLRVEVTSDCRPIVR